MNLRPADDLVLSPEFLQSRPRSPWAVLASVVGILIVMLAFGSVVRKHFEPAIIHPDANGYWAQASLLLDTGRTTFVPESNAQYVGMHWLLTEKNEYAARYPPGLPLLIAGVMEVAGPEASTLVNPVLATLTLLGVYLIVGRIASPGWGVAAAALLAINPAFLTHALVNISHTAVGFCIVWGFWLLLLWAGSGRKVYVILAGVILGSIPSIRYADAIIAVGVGAFLLAHWRSFPKIGWHYLAAFGGAMVPIVPLLVRNQLVFGAFWKTGYALTNEQTGFSVDYLTRYATGYLQMLQSGGLGMVFALGIVGVVTMLAVRGFRSVGLLMVGAIVPFVLVYMSYYWARGIGETNAAEGMRFMVPIVPLFAICAAWMLWRATQNVNLAARVAVPVVLVALQLLMYGGATRQALESNRDRKIPLVAVTNALREHARPGDVVVASGGVLQHLEFVREWKLADPSVINPMRGGFAGRGNADDPSPMQAEKNEARMKLYTGSNTDRARAFYEDAFAWAGDNSVLLVGSERSLTFLAPQLKRSDYEIIATFEIPKVDRPEAPRDGMPRFGPRNAPPQQQNQRRGGGGMFSSGLSPGDTVVIAKLLNPPGLSSRPEPTALRSE